MSIISLPVLPNSPLLFPDDSCICGNVLLRKNIELDFVENVMFDDSLIVYNQNYQNSQAYSAQFLEHMRDVVSILKNRFDSDCVIVEVGCGKGDFLELLEKNGFSNVSGFDCTYEGGRKNIHKRYLTAEDKIYADIVILRHTLEHIHKPHIFLEMLRKVFGAASIYIEVPAFEWIEDNNAFFDVTYEHVNYFTEKSLSNLFSGNLVEAGLLFRGQYQYVIADIENISEEFEHYYNNGCWENVDFFQIFSGLRNRIEEVDLMLNNNCKCYVWGAATKGCLFLVHSGFLNKIVSHVDFAVDINPNKYGKYLPGSLVQVKSKDDFFNAASVQDLLIVSNPVYLNEIMDELNVSRLRGMRVITL